MDHGLFPSGQSHAAAADIRSQSSDDASSKVDNHRITNKLRTVLELRNQIQAVLIDLQ